MDECTHFDLNSYLLFYSFCSTYLQCLWGHYPAITPKYLISTSLTWSRGLISKYGHLIMSFESHKWSEKCTRSDLRGSKIQKFPGGACPQTPLQGALSLHPQKVSLSIILPPLSIFLNETLDSVFICVSIGNFTVDSQGKLGLLSMSPRKRQAIQVVGYY